MKKHIIVSLGLTTILLAGIGLASARISNPPATSSVDTSAFMTKASNLSDLVSAATSRVNLFGTSTAGYFLKYSGSDWTASAPTPNPVNFIIENPTASENDGIFIFNTTSTITKVMAVNKTTGDSVTFGLGYGSSRATATSSLTQVLSGTTATVTATTTPTTITLNGTPTPGLGNVLIFYTTAASSSQFTLTAYFNEN